MGDSISAMHDDYDDYVYRCHKLGVEPVWSVYDHRWIDHDNELDRKEFPERYFKSREQQGLGTN